jgi:hypothetical protein
MKEEKIMKTKHRIEMLKKEIKEAEESSEYWHEMFIKEQNKNNDIMERISGGR